MRRLSRATFQALHTVRLLHQKQLEERKKKEEEILEERTGCRDYKCNCTDNHSCNGLDVPPYPNLPPSVSRGEGENEEVRRGEMKGCRSKDGFIS